MSALSSLLVQDQVVAVRDIEEALQRQVIFGGQLDTNLLELRAIDEDLLVEFMARVCGLPPVSREELEAAEPQAVGLLTREIAERHGIVPLALRGRRLRVALSGPPREGDLAEVSQALGVTLEPGVTSELRLRSALSRHYGAELSRRFSRLAALLATSPPPRLEPRQRPSAPAPWRPPAQARARATPTPSASPPPSRLAREAVVPDSPPEPAEEERTELDAGETVLSMEEGLSALDRAASSEQVLDLAVRVSGGYLEYAAVFVLRGAEARGKAAFGPGNGPPALEAVPVPLDQPGVLTTANESRSFYLGPIGPGESNGALLQAVRRPRPASALLMPVLLRHRVVALIYGDNGERGVSADELSALLPLASRMATAFERLIRTKKRDTLVSSDGPGPTAVEQGEPSEGSSPPAAAPPAPEAPAPRPAGAGPWTALAAGSGPWSGPAGEDSAAPEGAASEAPAPVQAQSAPEPGTREPAGQGLGEPPGRRKLQSKEGVVILLTEVLSDPAHRGHEPARAPAAVATELAADGGASGEPTAEVDRGPAAPAEPRPPAATLDSSELGDGSAEADLEPVVEVGESTGSELPSVIVDMGAEVEGLVERALGEGPGAEAAAAELVEAGEVGLPCLVRRFPGEVRTDWTARGRHPRSPAEHGRLLELLQRFGPAAYPYVAPLLGSGDPKVRFYAVILLGGLDVPEALETAGPRLLDLDPRVARITASLLPRAESGELPESILEGIKGVLGDQHASELHVQRAAEAAGALRDSVSVPLLIDLLREGTGDQRVAALRSLRTITGQEFGNSVRRWAAWWARARHQHRIEWLIDALDHRSERVRVVAANELRDLVPLDFGYSPSDPKRERDRSRRRYQQWWRETGRAEVPGAN